MGRNSSAPHSSPNLLFEQRPWGLGDVPIYPHITANRQPDIAMGQCLVTEWANTPGGEWKASNPCKKKIAKPSKQEKNKTQDKLKKKLKLKTTRQVNKVYGQTSLVSAGGYQQDTYTYFKESGWFAHLLFFLGGEGEGRKNMETKKKKGLCSIPRTTGNIQT